MRCRFLVQCLLKIRRSDVTFLSVLEWSPLEENKLFKKISFVKTGAFQTEIENELPTTRQFRHHYAWLAISFSARCHS